MSRSRLALAVLAAAAVILSAPYISLIRDTIRATFPGHFVLVLGTIVGGCVAVALALALIRIRDRRLRRYGCIAAAAIVAGVYASATSSADAQVAAVERFHFIEYGLLTFLFYRAWRRLDDIGVAFVPIVAAMLTATVEEWFQWFIPGRVGTVQDVLLNWVAIVCGLLFSLGLDPPANLTRFPGRDTLRHTRRIAVLCILVFALFFQTVHVGYVIADEDLGSFTSIYTKEALTEAARERSLRWRGGAPPLKTQLAREDQYRTEGIQHVQERNRAWDRGDVVAAWHENVILERYYEPVLGTGHRWPSEQRQDAEARASSYAVRQGYVSRAYPYEVHAWPPSIYWAVVAAALAGVLVLTRNARTRAQQAEEVSPDPRGRRA
jgi:hypothetical protein